MAINKKFNSFNLLIVFLIINSIFVEAKFFWNTENAVGLFLKLIGLSRKLCYNVYWKKKVYLQHKINYDGTTDNNNFNDNQNGLNEFFTSLIYENEICDICFIQSNLRLNSHSQLTVNGSLSCPYHGDYKTQMILINNEISLKFNKFNSIIIFEGNMYSVNFDVQKEFTSINHTINRYILVARVQGNFILLLHNCIMIIGILLLIVFSVIVTIN